MKSPPVVRSAAPLHRSLPRGPTSAGRDAVELAALAGLILDDWQADVLEGALTERADGRWAAFEVGLIVPRQNGKGAILEALELAALFLFENERLILHSAHEFKTAQEAFRRILLLIENCDMLRKQCKRVRTSHGEEGIELLNGDRLRFVARSTGSGRGFTGDRVILDEAYHLPAEAMSALLPTLSARPNPQIWYTSSAPLPREESSVLRALCRRGRAGESKSLAFFEWCAGPDDDPADPKTWAKANPALGIRISEEFVANEREVPGYEFARERLGVWDDLEENEAVIPRDGWAACEDNRSGLVGTFAYALDVDPGRSHGAVAVAGEAGAGGTHVEVVEYRRGTEWLVPRVKELQEKWGGTVAVAAGSPAASLLIDLELAGVEVLEVSTSDHAKACGNLYDAIVQGTLRHLGQRELDAAVAIAERRFYGDSWLWDRRKSTTGDISPLVAVTLAKWAHDQAPEPERALPEIIVL